MVLIISLMMARISTDNRERVIGLRQACLSQREKAQRLHCSVVLLQGYVKSIEELVSQCSAEKSYHNLLKTFVIT